MTDFAQAFSERPKQHFRCCANEIVVNWLVKLTRPIVQSHMTFLMRMVEFIL